jgi:hypothetical protein
MSFDVETDPRAKVVSGVVNREEDTVFDSWIHDNRRRGGYGTYNHIPIDKGLRFFDRGTADPRRSNHLVPGQFGSDQTFRIQALGLHISFSDQTIATEFIRSAVLRLWVGDKPIYGIHGHLLAQPPPFVEHLESDDPTESGLRLWISFDKRPIAIPPRQPFYMDMVLSGRLESRLIELTRAPRGFGMIKVMMKGIRTRSVFEDELSDEDRDELKRKHEEMMRQYEEERAAAAKRHEEEAKKAHERMAFLINAISPFGNDVHPEHIAKAQEALLEIDTTTYAIGGGGHPGGVPPFDSIEFGMVTAAEAGRRARGFPKGPGGSSLDLDALEETAWEIAKRRIVEKEPLDESYRKEVAAAVGISDFESALPPESIFGDEP